jgi:hypothetical protein
MEIDGSVKFFCVVCGLEGILLWNNMDLSGLLCPRCNSSVMTSHPVEEKTPEPVA